MKLHRPALKLAGLYLAIMMFISLFFSLTIYQLSIQEVYRGFRRQENVIDQSPQLFLPKDLRNELLNQRDEQYENAKADILGRLFIVNVTILIAGGFISYYLARRTIRPIEEARETQSRFIADASHELRTPMAVMQSEIEVALMDPKLSLKQAKEHLGSSLEELAKLINMSEGLLQLSQLEDGLMVKKQIDTRDLIQDTVQSNKAIASKKKVKLNLLNNPEIKVMADEEGLRKVLNILLDNAIKYSPKNSEVKVNVVKDKDKNLVISVEDNGIGIKPVEIKNIFDRFYRADSARTKSGTGGYGLGLSIAKSIVDMHGGSIDVASVPDKHTTFSVILPAYEDS